jgi:hypothetical protein
MDLNAEGVTIELFAGETMGLLQLTEKGMGN